MVLVQKWPFLQLFFKGNIGRENVFYDILERKNAFLGYKNQKFKTSKYWHFSKNFSIFPWFWSKNGHCSNFFFKGIIGQENICYDILARENAFLGYKNKKFKNWKTWNFCKGLTNVFGPEMAIFQLFVKDNIGLENVFYDIL